MKRCIHCGDENQEEAEFCNNCGAAMGSVSTPPEGGQPLPSGMYGPPLTPPSHQVPPYQPYPYYTPPTSGKAIASLVLGIVGLVVCPIICSVLAIIFGKQAKEEIEYSGGRIGGESFAKAGYILGIVGISLFAFAMLVWLIIFIIAASTTSSSPPQITLLALAWF